MKAVFIALSLVTLAGCAAQPQLMKQTQSGKAETVIPSVTVDEVRNEIILGCSKNGMEVDSSQNAVICSKLEEGGRGFAAQILAGNAYSGTPRTRVRFTFAQTGNDVYVVADPWLEMTMGFGEIKRIPLNNNGMRNELQRGLDQAAANARARKKTSPASEDTQEDEVPSESTMKYRPKLH